MRAASSPEQLRWSAQLISPAAEPDSAPLLRREVRLDRPATELAQAVVHVSAWGVVELFMNGRPVSEDVLEPGWSSYPWRLRYRSYDVTNLVADRTVLVAALGNGWFRGRLGWTGARAVYGDRLAAIVQLELTFTDGHVQTIGTDEQWQAGPSQVLADDLYDGQTVDARRPGVAAASSPGASLDDWGPVEVLDADLSVLTLAHAPPVRRTATIDPVSVERRGDGRYLLDFGQNLVGWLRLAVRGAPGDEVVLRHAEVLHDGELALAPLRTAQACDRYVLSGGDDVLEPTFTFHGFRYAEVAGWPGALEPGQVRAVVVHSDLTPTGSFRCSDPLLTRFHQNVVWSTRGNFLALPTDCPQRDERLGWTGDIAVFATTAAFLFDTKDFLGDWLADLAVEQAAEDGRVPAVVPDLFRRLGPDTVPQLDGTAVWGDAAVWVPWALWQAYGDPTVLESSYESMAAHVRRVLALRSERGVVDTTREFGDWLDPDAPADMPWQAKTPAAVVATACLHRSARLVAAAAAVLGRRADSAAFAAAADEVRAAFLQTYVQPDGTVTGDAATGYALAIEFGLLDADQQRLAGDRLAALVEQADFRISTGFAGTPYVCDALTTTGHVETAYRLLLQREAPSWLHPVVQGATTIWERWDSLLPDGTPNPDGMTSFNHYALGAVADFVHRVVGGIAPLEPGYGRVLVAPRPGGDLTWADTSLTTGRGTISVRWRLDGDLMHTTVELPEGVPARIAPGGAAARDVVGGVHEISGPVHRSP